MQHSLRYNNERYTYDQIQFFFNVKKDLQKIIIYKCKKISVSVKTSKNRIF